MFRKRRGLWIGLFISLTLLVTLLATGWSVVLVRDYLHMVALAQKLSVATELKAPWAPLVFGSLGYAAALALIILFFIKVLKEMKLNQLQSEFLEQVSHELKTPIAAIELSSSLLRGGGLSEEEVSRLWQSHELELKRLRVDVEALLESARVQAKPLKLQPSPVVLEDWIRGSLERWQKILGPDAMITREGEPLAARAMLDIATLDLITDNLIDNARKFAKAQPRVVIRTRRNPGKWQIEFQDDGWGFAPSESKKIFTRFYRARTNTQYSIPGSGLGLSIAESASQALKLKLRGESAGEGKGAKFTLEGRELA